MIRGIPQARYVRHGYAATANLVVPAAVFRALGGFDARRFSGGDAEFCRRAGAAGHPIRLVPEAVVLHPARSRWDELAAKTRRVTGGQVGAGPPRRRLVWFLRTLTPPLRALWRFARAASPRRGPAGGDPGAVRPVAGRAGRGAAHRPRRQGAGAALTAARRRRGRGPSSRAA